MCKLKFGALVVDLDSFEVDSYSKVRIWLTYLGLAIETCPLNLTHGRLTFNTIRTLFFAFLMHTSDNYLLHNVFLSSLLKPVFFVPKVLIQSETLEETYEDTLCFLRAKVQSNILYFFQKIQLSYSICTFGL